MLNSAANMSTGLVTSISARILVEQCESLGIDRKELLNHAGLSCESIRSPFGYVSAEKMNLLWHSAVDSTKDEMLGLHAAEKVPFGTYRVLDHMLALSSSLKEGLVRSSRTFGMANSAFTVSLRLHGELAYFEVHALSQNQCMTRAHIEYILGNYLTRLRIVTQMRCKPVEAHFTFGPPSSLAEYGRIIGATVRFRQAINRMVFPRELLEVKLPSADPELCEILEDYAQRRLHRMTHGNPAFIEIRNAVAQNLASGDSTLTFLARQFAKSCRALQREIQANGMTYRELLDMARRERALALLGEHDMPVKEVAIRLNFGDPSSFCRAFRRWTGKTPAQYKNQNELN